MYNLVILSNHHRRSYYFEDGMRHLNEAGYHKIFIQDTGNEAWGQYQGPCMKLVKLGNISFDQGEMQYPQTISSEQQDPMDPIFFIDNDCFLSDVTHFEKFLNEFMENGYDFSCHVVQPSDQPIFEENETIALVDQKFADAGIYPWFVPVPHWEACYLLIRRWVLDKLTPQDLSHTRLLIKALVREKVKEGIHKCSYRGGYSHFGPGWFHIGNFMAFCYKAERGDVFNENSPVEMARLGHLLEQGENYSWDIYPQHVKEFLQKQSSAIKKKAYHAWCELIAGTCMENWKKYASFS